MTCPSGSGRALRTPAHQVGYGQPPVPPSMPALADTAGNPALGTCHRSKKPQVSRDSLSQALLVMLGVPVVSRRQVGLDSLIIRGVGGPPMG